MDDAKAIELLHELIAAEIEVVKAANTSRGPSKAAEKRERRAAQQVFRALAGHEASDEQISKIISY